MSSVSFRSVFMVASCAIAALVCYLVSLHVASERAALQEVETQIVLAERDIRVLETEIGTRGRLAQLERWNLKVLAMSAPSADQFLDGEFALASLMRPERKSGLEAPVVLASASADEMRPQVAGVPESPVGRPDEAATAEELLHVASLKRPQRDAARPTESGIRSEASPSSRSAEPQAVEKKAGDKPRKTASSAVTKAVGKAKVDPLAPLPAAPSKTAKDTGSAR